MLTFAGWIHRQQADAITYLTEENRVLREQLGDKPLRLTDAQRRRLAVKGKALGRKLLGRVATIVTPDTILRWHRRLVAEKWTHEHPRKGRRGLMKELKKTICRLARENSGWGYARICGELKKLGHKVAPSTIAKTLHDAGIPPSPQRPTTWREFLRSHAGDIAGMDFFTTEVWTPRGLVTHYTLFAIQHGSRRVHVAGTTVNPDEAFMTQVARNLTDSFDGFLRSTRHLLIDRDTKFCESFRRILEDAGVRVTTTAYLAPNMNAFAERWVKSVKTELLSRRIFFGTRSLERALADFVAHYNEDRPHQGIGNRPISGDADIRPADLHGIAVDEKQGGILKSYRTAARTRNQGRLKRLA